MRSLLFITTALVGAAICLAVLSMGGCEPTAPRDDKGDCVEFDHKTMRAGRGITCRMVWCQGMKFGTGESAGVATLWCEDPASARAERSGAAIHMPGIDVQVGDSR